MIIPRPIIAADASVGHPIGSGLAGAGDAAVLRAPFDMPRPVMLGAGGGARWVDVTWSFRGANHVGGSGAQQRRSRGDAPALLVAFAVGAIASSDAPAHVASLLRGAHSLTPAPLWSDKSVLTSAAVPNPGDQRLVCPTADRMFFPGGRVALIEPRRGSAYPARWQVCTIKASGVLSDQLKVEEDLDVTWPVRCWVVPLFEAQPVAEETLRLITGRLGTGERAYRSADPRLFSSALPALLADGAAPGSPSAATYDGLPIFDLWPEWSASPTVGVRRDVGDGMLLGDRAALTFEGSLLATSRLEARRFLAWFSGRRGRTHPFWFVTPLRGLEMASGYSGGTISGTTIDVNPIGWRTRFGAEPSLPSMPWPLDRIAVVVRDGSAPGGRAIYIRRITGSADGTVGGLPAETLTLDASLPTIAVGLIDRIAWAAKGRFDQDEVTERWLSTTKCRMGVRIIEALNEKTVEVGVGPACPAAQPQSCGCAAGADDFCSGHPARTTPLTLAPGGSPELTACGASPDGYVLGQAGGGAPLVVRLGGWFRGEEWGAPCSGVRHLVAYASARWEAEVVIPTPGAHAVAFTNTTLTSGGGLVVKSVADSYGACAGPTSVAGGTPGIVKATIDWRYSGGQRLLKLEMRGLDGATGLVEFWRMTVDVNSAGVGSAGGQFAGAWGLSPIAQANWVINPSQPKGLTALAARAAQVGNREGDLWVEGEMSVRMCPVYRCS